VAPVSQQGFGVGAQAICFSTIVIILDLSRLFPQKLKAVKVWNHIFQVMKEYSCQFTLMYLAEVSFIIEGEI
jgi:hypothetical protein